MSYGERTAEILIVDDWETNRQVLEQIIRGIGARPVLAESAEAALRKIRVSRPQLILTDISMPGMDGYELCKILKADKKTKNIPVIFISAYDNPKDVIEGLTLGGADYITKPFIPEVVQARVGIQLRLYAAHWELQEMNRRLQTSVAELLKQIEQEKKDVLYALAGIAARNSCYKKEHIDRLSQNCRILAQGMQLSPLFEDKISDAYIDTIELAAPLCDIGNIGIPLELLRRQTALSDEEMAIVQTHTIIGANLLEDLHVGKDYNDFINTAADVARYHHENWDGSGYPEGLKKEEIPLAAQIVSIVEVYCALTDKKNYGREEAFEIMSREADMKFNPEIYKICRKISRRLL
ncbi:MAG: response regulator [Lachnospiraceae bacterium]|nr:HD domain-containing phosphohydrolase [uncultured Acetatifactor sp.]MCI8287194.1 response regulator [Lachnospiraceae bacterium]